MFVQAIRYCSVCMGDVKFKDGLLCFKVIPEIEMCFLEKRSCIFWYAFGITNSTAACCDLKSFCKLRCAVLRDIMCLSVCFRDLNFSSGLLRFEVILEMEL